MKLYILPLLLFFSISNCKYNPKIIRENNENYHNNIIDSIQIMEKPSDNSIWKKYYIKFHNLKKDIPGEYTDPPYILKYKNKFILACLLKRETIIFIIKIENNQLIFIPVTEKNNHKLFMDKCRFMKYYPIRFVNGTWLKLENGQLVSDYSIECSSKESPEPDDIIYLEFKGIFDIDFKENILKLKNIEGPTD